MTHALLRVISSFTGHRSLKLWQMESGNCLKKETWRHEREDGVWEGIIKRGAEMKESRKGSRELVQGVLETECKFPDNLEGN